jgi:hypothetical protein
MPKYIVKLKATGDVTTTTTVEAEDEETAGQKALEESDLKWDCENVHPGSLEVTSLEKSKITIVTRRDQIFTDKVLKIEDAEPAGEEAEGEAEEADENP